MGNPSLIKEVSRKPSEQWTKAKRILTTVIDILFN
jgi:hypothetical protein